MYRRTFTAEEMLEFDRLFCMLHSLGSTITQVCNLESEEPDIPSLADLGRLVCEKANLGLDHIQESVRSHPTQAHLTPGHDPQT